MWPFKTQTEDVTDNQDSAVAVATPNETKAQEPIKQPAPMPSTYEPRVPKIDGEEMEAYVKLCEEIGIDCCTDLTREKLLKCFREENIHVYNFDQVVAYLDDKLGSDWEWRGMRTVDVNHLNDKWHIQETKKHRRVEFASEPYRGAIPMPVLLTVRKIQQAVPDVYFYVSSRKDQDGDPFLMVTNRWLYTYVIERWNEPNFRER